MFVFGACAPGLRDALLDALLASSCRSFITASSVRSGFDMVKKHRAEVGE
jgi:hypothetical protein